MNPRPAQWERPDFVSQCVFCNMPVMCAPVQVRPHSATFHLGNHFLKESLRTQILFSWTKHAGFRFLSHFVLLCAGSQTVPHC